MGGNMNPKPQEQDCQPQARNPNCQPQRCVCNGQGNPPHRSLMPGFVLEARRPTQPIWIWKGFLYDVWIIMDILAIYIYIYISSRGNRENWMTNNHSSFHLYLNVYTKWSPSASFQRSISHIGKQYSRNSSTSESSVGSCVQARGFVENGSSATGFMAGLMNEIFPVIWGM